VTTDLSASAVRTVLDLVAEAHHAEDLDAFRRGLLVSLPQVVPADYASYNEVRFDGSAGLALVEPDLPDWAYEAWGRFAHQNPLVHEFLRTRDGRAKRFSDVVSRDELEALDLYRELYRPFGIEHQVAVTLPAPPTLVIGVVLNRGGEDFTARECGLLDLARPHLIQAYRNVQLRERLSGVVDALRTGLDETGEAVVVLDAGGRVAFATARGREALRELTGGGATDGERVPAPLAGEGPARLAVNGTTVRRVRADRDGAQVLLFEAGPRLPPAALLEDLGLTPREAEVLHALMGGRGTAEIAHALTISPRTVHKHTERILGKLGAHDRVEAVAAAWAAVEG
jgi:DNA-binding CsgD family transcriptional regulator